MKINSKYKRPWWQDKENSFAKWLLKVAINLLGFSVLCTAMYFALSSFFDTRREWELRHSTDMLNTQYKALTARFDSLNTVINNIEQRDANVFKILFETEPYDIDDKSTTMRWANHERLISKSLEELNQEFNQKLSSFQNRIYSAQKQSQNLIEKTKALGSKTNKIPAIQPVINPELTKLAASYGMRMHPYHRTIVSHQGVDFAINEGSRIFATADGIVSTVSTKSSNNGNSITIDHGNGYKTVYNHLSKINVRRGRTVRRGDIIALSGNSGLSFAPHLHYEVMKDGMRVDPIHYFFMELSANDYNKMLTIAQSGMQSLD